MSRVLSLLLFSSAVVLAQLNRGTITGNVTDATGAAVPTVKVSATSEGTGQATVTTSNEFGQYNLPNLVTGTYTLSYESANFKKSVRAGVELGVTQVLRIDVTLEVGSTVESVSVSGALPKLQTDTPDVGTSLDNKQLLELPLTFAGARLAENFAYKVTPGVSSNSWTSNINGSTAFSKESLLDGATVTTYLSGHFGESSVSVEALQEFRIQTSGMSAEFGRAQSGVFNYVMKSGQNHVHGSAYGALRNEAFNANTFANKFRGQPRGRDRRQNFAFSFGGPVYIPKVYNGRNKTFFYATYEKYRERLTGFGSPNTTAPLPEWLNGDMSRLIQTVIPGTTDALGRQVIRGAIYDPATFRQLDGGRYIGEMFPNNTIPTSRFSQVSRNVLGMMKGYLPVVKNADGSIPLVNNAIRPAAGTPEFDQNQYAIKGDHFLNSHMKLSGSFSLTKRPRLLLDQTRLWDPSDPLGGVLTSARRQVIKSTLSRVAYDWNVSPTILNNLTVYYNRMANPNVGAFRDIDGSKELGIRNLSTFGYPNINWGGGPFVALTNIGDPQNDFQVYMGYGLINTTSFSRGKHFFKAGVDVRRNHLNTRPTQGGSFNFNPRGTAIPNEAISGTQTGYAFASFLLGIVDSAGLSDPVGLGGRREYMGLFFQDDWKVTSRLTLNIGLRWEYQPPFMEVANRLSSWSHTVRDPQSGRNGAYEFAGNCSGCTGGRYFGNRSLRDFGPRIGFAWRAADRWTVRGSFGIMYEGDLFNGFSGTPLGKASSVQVGGTWNLNADAVNPWAGIFNWDSGLPTNRFIPAAADVSWGNSNRPGIIDPQYGRTAYTSMWNLNVQRELGRGFVLDLGYVANKATGIRAGELGILNQLDPALLQTVGRNLLNQVRNPAEAAANGVAYPYAGFAGNVAKALSMYPQVQGNNTVNAYGSPVGFSTYHSMQIILNKQFSNGITMYSNYVWSKNLTNVESSMVGSNPGAMDIYNRQLEKALANDDQPAMFKGFVSYDLPFGKGRKYATTMPKVVNAMFGGWSVSGIFNYFAGTPLTFNGSAPIATAWNGGANRLNIASGELGMSGFSKNAFEFSTQGSPNNTYLNKAMFGDPVALTLGTATKRPGIRGFGTINEDFGLQKNFRFAEKYRFQIRSEFLNAFNRGTLGGINTSITSPVFGQVTSISGNRSIQFGLRLDF